MKVLMIGDIVGRPGRRLLKERMSWLKQNWHPDLIIANGENAAAGAGITREIAEELYNAGVDVLTMGNHTWDKRQVLDFIDEDQAIVRPANYPPGTPGRGWLLTEIRPDLPKVAVVNIMGRVFMSDLDCPFRCMQALLEDIRKETSVIIVDIHAEATSEKIAMGYFLDGMVSAVVGTHTHVQTADQRVLPKGTAYITDVGMTGPKESVLGIEPEIIITKFLQQRPIRFEVAEGPAQINGVLIEIDPTTGLATDIQRISFCE